MVYVAFLQKENDSSELNKLSCSWRYYCQEEFHFCEYGCSSKKSLKAGYNLLSTTNLRENCFINVECENHQIYFDTEDPVHFLFFAKPFFRLNRGFTLYVHLARRNDGAGERAHHGDDRTETTIWRLLRLTWKRTNEWRRYISKKHKRSLIKLLICLILIHMILFYLYIYTYLYLDKQEEL
ncbi:hypothetical protein PVIIG_01108 [Plasmodium vivax India VII]|uniref:Uncharacterized protein n=6 Tax=Plasmodium vivax TaxID=5855 RepID=A5K254_PLAVS|nr:hypothetical protein, conserved [Plasmodium vivax]KMZ79834.1 hypothetical protein PVIIG_01108 [Plasmodium vivax India VII]KMZ85630.1 hypothetical protein PVBG_01142 [Plasmodium vivax Brazil I]KMZ92107.1 hypothetical protein PVMG_02095 [Plasmodium vivax Mauritania I]KMZ98618.1 hypothetical protein PVNG_03681 [Plasmodium vivax North Korean]EDL46504.1 hypothetical protein, conserved [Plasmodium vivax]|eukprot:XP_001616231.1 hypothetical protein [Plasmodium vivax Sal-1]